MHEALGLLDDSWIAKLTSPDGRFSLAEEELVNDYRAVVQVQTEAAAAEDYRQASWAKARAQTIAGEDVLSFLSRKAVIPKYGFPVDVVELDTRNAGGPDAGSVNLQRDLAMAVAEFAPSSSLVANKKVWTSYGLKRVAGKEWPRWHYGYCAQHNHFVRGTTREEVEEKRCCTNLRAAQYVDPLFGFTTDRRPPSAPTQKPSRTFSTRPFFVGFTNAQPDWADLDFARLRPAASGYLVVLCQGKKQNRFYVCPTCGAGFTEIPSGPHKTPYGQPCSTQALGSPIALGHEFVTDVLEVQFQGAPEQQDPLWFAYGLAYALVAGAAEVLQVSPRISTPPLPMVPARYLRSSSMTTSPGAPAWWRT